MVPGYFAFPGDANAFEILKKAGGTVVTSAGCSPKTVMMHVKIEIGGIEFRAFKTVKTEAAEHLLTDELSERKAS